MQIGRPRGAWISGYMGDCVTPRDRRTVRPAASSGQASTGFPRKSRQGSRQGGEVSGIAQACADTSLPTEVLSAVILMPL